MYGLYIVVDVGISKADEGLGTTCGEYIYKGRKFNASRWIFSLSVYTELLERGGLR